MSIPVLVQNLQCQIRFVAVPGSSDIFADIITCVHAMRSSDHGRPVFTETVSEVTHQSQTLRALAKLLYLFCTSAPYMIIAIIMSGGVVQR